MLGADKKYFDGFRIFALFTLLCTVVLWIALWGASATPGDKSGASSDAVTSIVDGKYDLSQKFDSQVVTQNLIVKRTTSDARFIGDTEQVVVEYFPQNTLDKDVTYTTDNPNVATVDENGLVTLTGRGETWVYATLKSNPEITNWVYFLCCGKNPLDCNPPTIEFGKTSIKVGESTDLTLNKNTTATYAANITSSDESVAVVKSGRVSGRKAGSATITATYPDGTVVSDEITVVNNPDYIAPTQIVLQSQNIYQSQIIGAKNFLKNVLPSGAPQDFIVTSDKPNIVGFRNDNLHVYGYGEFTLTFTSRFDDNVTASITLYSQRRMPTELRVSGPDLVSPNNYIKYSAYHLPDPATSEVKWEIISGKYATIDENGVFRAKFFGTYVIRCTSTVNPELVIEKTVEVKLFSSPYELVRKLMGHLGLSGVLGFGLFFTCLFLCKHKWKCCVYPFVLSFIHAGISEGIQYFTPQRFCTFADVVTDFTGSIIGIGIGVFLTALISLLWYIISKRSFARIVYVIKHLDFGNCFRKIYKFDSEYVREPLV